MDVGVVVFYQDLQDQRELESKLLFYDFALFDLHTFYNIDFIVQLAYQSAVKDGEQCQKDGLCQRIYSKLYCDKEVCNACERHER